MEDERRNEKGTPRKSMEIQYTNSFRWWLCGIDDIVFINFDRYGGYKNTILFIAF